MVACLLVSKAWPSIQSIAIVAQADQVEALDEALWQSPNGRFLPHEPAPTQAPIEIGTEAPTRVELLINLNPNAPLPTGEYTRVLEIVPATEEAKAPLRERWRAWKARGASLNHHALK